MTKNFSRKIYFIASLAACSVMALSTGCASGGYKLTRDYSRWVNSNNVIVRVVLYLLTGIIYAVTMLVDLVFFNTMDFWQGKVTAGDYQFKDKDKTFLVKHEFIQGTQRRQSTIQIMNEQKSLLQTVVLSENAQGEVEMFVDGKLKTRVSNIDTLPVAKFFNEAGSVVGEDFNVIGTVVTAR